ncbi:MAG: cyclic-di-AMP receptor [Eubacteriales bacterium]
MKLVIAIVNNDDSSNLSKELIEKGFSATKLATTGGFLKSGNTTLLIGVESERLDELMGIISDNCKKRKEMVPSAAVAPFTSGMYSGMPIEITIGGATVFVVDVERFEKL